MTNTKTNTNTNAKTTTVNTAATALGAITPAQRIWRVVKLHHTNKWTLIWVPWIIVTGVSLVNLAIVALIASSVDAADRHDAVSSMQYNGMSFYFFVYMLIVALQAINVTFPFALGYSVTRRDYYLGTSLTFVLLSAAYSCAFTLLSYIEEFTHGWGLSATIFTSVYFGNGPVWQRLFIFFVGLAFFFFVGTISGCIYQRWRTNGLLVYAGVVSLVLLGSVTLITLTHSWGAVGVWFATSGPFGVVTWMLAPAAIAAIAGFFILSGATPKN